MRKKNNVESIYFTITGTSYRYGKDFLEKDMKVYLEKDTENEHDKEAIKVEMEGLGQIGWVANSTNTVLGESWSAGRIYDRIDDNATGTVLYVLDKGVICRLDGVYAG